MRRGGIALDGRVGDLLRRARKLAQGWSERERALADLGTDAVRLVFAAAANSELHERSRKRRENYEHQTADRADAVAVAVAAAEIESEIGEHRNRAGKRCGDGHGERVAVLDVPKLVREHAGKLVAVQPLEQPGGDRDRGMIGIAPRGKRVRLRIVHNEDLGHGQPSVRRKPPYQPVELGRRALVDFARAIHGEHHLVGVPIGEQVHHRGDEKGNNHAGLAAHQITDAHEEGGHGGKQDGRAEIAHRTQLLARGKLARAHGKYVGSAGPHHKYGPWSAHWGRRRGAVSPPVTLTLHQGLTVMLAGAQKHPRVAPMSLTLLAPPSEAVSASPSLTREQKRHIRETFAIIEPASDLVARLFYMKSVDLDPSLGTLFKSPSRVQRRKFMAALKVAVLSLDRLQSLQPILKLLGTRQREEGVNPGHYETFQCAWVWTLEQSLQARFPREAKDAWSSLLGEMTRATASTH